MRLWHKDLIKVLPKKQLQGQWRELVAIAKDINEKGTTNHILINKIMDYPLEHFKSYSILIIKEMYRRKIKIRKESIRKIFSVTNLTTRIPYDNIYNNWQNERYFLQCYYNLQEKYDCYGLTDTEWKLIFDLKNKKYNF